MNPSNIAENKTDHPPIVSQAEWLAARRALLAKEKEFTRQRDALSAERRKLPCVQVEKEYAFEGSDGRVNLHDLFGKQRQLIVYHFMFDPEWEEGCKSCSFLADSFPVLAHFGARNTAFAVVSRAPIGKLEAFKKRMGWNFPWYSSFGSDFNYDFRVTLDEAQGAIEYNYQPAAALRQAGKIWMEKGELPGLSVFLRDGENVFHTYSTYQRGLDIFLNTYNYLDMTPLGRQEEGERIMAWVRHHDKYSAEQGPNAPTALTGALRDHERPLQKSSNMTGAWLGEHSKMTVLPSERDRVQRFYHEVLGCQVTKKSETADLIQLGTNFYIGVIYDDSALSELDLFKSIWLEIRTDHPEELKQKILKFGIREVTYWDKEHFYFQAPGGQVFRLVSSTEDMSKWQR